MVWEARTTMSNSQLPPTLWHEERIRLPQHLADALRAELTERGLLDEACVPHIPDKELVGGQDDEKTIKHFTQRFKTSAARVQFVVLNPNGTFEPLSTDLRACLLDGRIAILDIPCGSGGGLLGLLATIVELRLQAFLPPLPLEVGILAGDFSTKARSIHASMLQRFRGQLERVGMRLRWEHSHWDITDPFSTAALIDAWFRLCPDCEEYLVFVSAFSRYAAKNTDPVLQAVRDIAVRFHDKTLVIAWIEPITNESKRFVPRLWDALAKLFSWSTKNESDPMEEFEYLHPFTDEVIKGRARVLPFTKNNR
jgi:hypothetical protein